jgi:hypothetical protein
MWWDGKIQRTFRCRSEQKPGSLGRLLSAIGDGGGLARAVARVALAQGLNRDDLTGYFD